MPYFKWRGVDLAGSIRQGSLFAPSEDFLDTILFRQDIALLSCSQHFFYIARAIPLSAKVEFFKQFASLMESGLLVHDALEIIIQYTSNGQLQSIIFEVMQHVKQGTSLSDALDKHRSVFGIIEIQMIRTGQNSGSLAVVSQEIARYLHTRDQFYQQIRSATTVPLISFVFFLFIMLVIFLGIMPKLIEILKTSGKPLPLLTQIMIAISNFFKKRYALLAAGVVAVSIVSMRWFVHTQYSACIDRLVLHLPVIGGIIKKRELIYFTRALSLLLHGGMQLFPAIESAKEIVSNRILYHRVQMLQDEIKAGGSLSAAMAHQPEWFDPATIAVVHVGYQASKMKEVLLRIAQITEEKVAQQLFFIVKIMQPALIIVMGLLVATLLFSVYIPLFSISDIVGFN
jgi:type II secretory pathway component PulF